MKEIKLVVFDLDGVIIDSEWAHESAKTRIYTSLGVTGHVDLAAFTGRSNRLFWQKILNDFGVEGNVDELVKQQFALVMEELMKARQRESSGLTDLLKLLKSRGIKTAVSSGSEEYFIRDILDYLKISEYFDCVITGNDIVRLKPDPDIYLAALRLSGTAAENAIAVEDSAAGCQAAKSAGLICVGYTNNGKNPQNLEKADFRIDRLLQLEGIIFGELGKQLEAKL